jgi:hypothetical protein
MHRRWILFAVLVIALSISGYVFAQDSATPPSGSCASPGATPVGSPVAVLVGTPADVPGSSGEIAPRVEVLYDCGTPAGGFATPPA